MSVVPIKVSKWNQIRSFCWEHCVFVISHCFPQTQMWRLLVTSLHWRLELGRKLNYYRWKNLWIHLFKSLTGTKPHSNPPLLLSIVNLLKDDFLIWQQLQGFPPILHHQHKIIINDWCFIYYFEYHFKYTVFLRMSKHSLNPNRFQFSQTIWAALLLEKSWRRSMSALHWTLKTGIPTKRNL